MFHPFESDTHCHLIVFRCVAQLVEHLAFNQLVEGSNPSAPTSFKRTMDH
jgi:hypothetical protein